MEKTRIINIRISDQEHAKIKELAKTKQKSVSAYLRDKALCETAYDTDRQLDQDDTKRIKKMIDTANEMLAITTRMQNSMTKLINNLHTKRD